MTELTKTSLKKLSISVLYGDKTRTSFCWKYFGHLIMSNGYKKSIVNTDQVYCSVCLIAAKKESGDITFGSVKIKSYKNTVSTGNMTRHLRDDHQIVYQADQTTSDDKSIVKIKSEPTETKSRAKSRSAKSSISTSSTIVHPRLDSWLLAKDLALWFCKSLLPFDSVSDEGMMDFLKNYDVILNDNDLPSRETVSGSALTDVYEYMLSKVKETIITDAAQHFALTFDSWTDQYRRLNYLTFTLHYLMPDFVLKSLTLSTEIMSGKNTDENINYVIQEIKKRFNLDEKKIVAVTDAGANVKRAVVMANMTHQLCLGNGLHNLVTVDGINSVPEISNLVLKIKNIVQAVRYRTPELLADAENKQQMQFLHKIDGVLETLEHDEGDPIHEFLLSQENIEAFEFEHRYSPTILSSSTSVRTAMPTRWHSILEMLETVIHTANRDLINIMLKKIGQAELIISEEDWILLIDLVRFLKSFQEAVEILMSQKTCTLNVALVFRSEVIAQLDNLDYNESPCMLRLKHNMMANINKRFPVTKPMVAAALLDNRFISLKEIDLFLERHNLTRTSFLSAYVKEITSLDFMSESFSEIYGTDIKTEISLLQKLSKKHSIGACQGNQYDPVEQECLRYFAGVDAAEPKDGDLLSYWNSVKLAFPSLASLAKALLCVPATSTPSERMFSGAGLTISAKRSRLSPIRINKIMFIHDNYKTCQN